MTTDNSPRPGHRVVAERATFLDPMLASAGNGPFSHPDWDFEVKWDGFRVEAVISDGQRTLFSRRGQRAEDWFPDLAQSPTWAAAKSAVFDGEVVALDSAGRASFSLLQTRLGRTARGGAPGGGVVYKVFDVLHLDGYSVRHLPLRERRALLTEALLPNAMVMQGEVVFGDGEKLFSTIVQQGIEGMVAKLGTSRYEPGQRSRNWLKIKARLEQEFIVCGWEPSKSLPSDLGSLLLGVHDQHGALCFAGSVGTGFTATTRAQMLAALRTIEQPGPSCLEAPRSNTAHWVVPCIVVRCEFADWTTDNRARQASFKGVDPDRDPAQVIRERSSPPSQTGPALRRPGSPASRLQRPDSLAQLRTRPSPERPNSGAHTDELRALDTMPPKGIWTIGAEVIAVSGLDNVLVASSATQPAVTKRDLMRYYCALAPVLLPLLADRSLPSAITAPERRNAHRIVDTVVELARWIERGMVELRPALSTMTKPERPTYAVVAIVPGPAVIAHDVATVTGLFKAAFDHLGIAACPKTAINGIELWVPIRPTYTFDDTTSWVEKVSRMIASAMRGLIIVGSRRDLKPDRVLLTTASDDAGRPPVVPYTAILASGMPIAVPLEWSELQAPPAFISSASTSPWSSSPYSTGHVPQRLASFGDPFANVAGLEQVLPPV